MVLKLLTRYVNCNIKDSFFVRERGQVDKLGVKKLLAW